MTLRERIEADIKEAMKSGETVTRDTLRMVLSALKNKRIEKGDELDEGAELAVLSTAVKSRQDSADQYDKAGREDLRDKERAEIAVIQKYLPKMLGEEETRALVERTVGELGLSSKKEIGRLMKAVMAEHRGAVDGKVVQRIAGELLA